MYCHPQKRPIAPKTFAEVVSRHEVQARSLEPARPRSTRALLGVPARGGRGPFVARLVAAGL